MFSRVFLIGTRTRVSLAIVLTGLICLLLADIEVTTLDPWGEVGRLLKGFLSPDLFASELLLKAVITTFAFAFCGVAVAVLAGFGLSFGFNYPVVRWFCAVIRSVHELFWALLFMQVFGLHPLTGLLAIAIPYAGVFARVYSELLAQVDPEPGRVISRSAGNVSRLFYGRVASAWPHLISYTSYRLECGLRSSAVLGFVGLPTLGYFLESAFSQGVYSEVAALLMLFYFLIGTKKFWLSAKTVPVWLAVSPFFLGEGLPIQWTNVWRFLSSDIVPAPLVNAQQVWTLETMSSLYYWWQDIFRFQAIPGLIDTLVLSQVALLLTGMLALLWFPLISKHCFSPAMRGPGYLWLIVARSTPEYLMAYILLQLFGPSMLPAIIALAIHNGALIGYLTGRQSNELVLRMDHTTRLSDLYCYELLPRNYSALISFLLYRWEVIMRETAILGILGIYTIGFYIDSAIQEIRFDVALVLIILSALLNIGVDSLSRYLQRFICY